MNNMNQAVSPAMPSFETHATMTREQDWRPQLKYEHTSSRLGHVSINGYMLEEGFNEFDATRSPLEQSYLKQAQDTIQDSLFSDSDEASPGLEGAIRTVNAYESRREAYVIKNYAAIAARLEYNALTQQLLEEKNEEAEKQAKGKGEKSPERKLRVIK